MLKRACAVLLLIVFTFWFPIAFKRWTHAFRPAKCSIDWPHVPEWEIPPLKDEKKQEILATLSEPFSYFSKGSQCYVFLSKNQKYVLKLFRYDHCRIPFAQNWIRQAKKWMKIRDKHFLPTNSKIVKNFTSCKLAYDHAQKQTGVVFVHLNPKKGLPILTLKDRLGRIHKIDPALYRFALQKKAEPFLKTLYDHKQDIAPYFRSYLTLLEDLASLGLVNLDHKMKCNFGFLDGRVVLIDFGNFVYSPERAKDEIAHFQLQLVEWLKLRIPDLEL